VFEVRPFTTQYFSCPKTLIHETVASLLTLPGSIFQSAGGRCCLLVWWRCSSRWERSGNVESNNCLHFL